MTEHEAISILKRITTTGNRTKAISKAVETLKRNEPIKPYGIVKLAESDHLIGSCGNCHKPVLSTESYCPKCGQKVGWYDEESTEVTAD